MDDLSRNEIHPLGRRIGRQIIELYLNTAKSADEQADLILVGEAMLRGKMEDSSEKLADVSSRMIEYVAADLNRRMGRLPPRKGDWRVIQYGLTSARTLRQAIDHCIDCFEAFDGRWGWMSLNQRSGVTDIRLDARRPERNWAACLVDLSGMSQLHSLLAWLIARPLPLHSISLDHDPGALDGLDREEISAPLFFDKGWSGFSISSIYLDYPCVRTAEEFELQPPSSFLFEGAGRRSAETAAQHVRRLALKALVETTRLPKFDEVAARIGSRPITLRRSLARDGTSYREIKDSCRRELGLALLRQSNLSIEEIAARLDFCDADAFRQAFRKWTGTSPSLYRREF